MDHAHVQGNAEQRARLANVAGGLSAGDLRLTLRNGMTVAAALVHLAYWDTYCLAVLRQWAADGVTVTRGNLEASNAALAVVAAAVPPEAAVSLAERAAADVDAFVEVMDAALIEAIERGHATRMIDRARHRRAHLDQIEDAVARSGGAS